MVLADVGWKFKAEAVCLDAVWAPVIVPTFHW